MNVTSSLIASCIICIGSEQGAISKMLITDTEVSKAASNFSSSTYNNNSKKYTHLFSELYSYRELTENWDGYNGIRPSDDIISTASKFLNILQENLISSPEIMLSGSGEVALFWKNNNDYIEVSFDISNHLTYFYILDSIVYGEDDIFINTYIPEKLYGAINYLQNELSSKKSRILIENTNDTFSSIIEVA